VGEGAGSGTAFVRIARQSQIRSAADEMLVQPSNTTGSAA
jgi:hypothetical protein